MTRLARIVLALLFVGLAAPAQASAVPAVHMGKNCIVYSPGANAPVEWCGFINQHDVTHQYQGIGSINELDLQAPVPPWIEMFYVQFWDRQGPSNPYLLKATWSGHASAPEYLERATPWWSCPRNTGAHSWYVSVVFKITWPSSGATTGTLTRSSYIVNGTC